MLVDVGAGVGDGVRRLGRFRCWRYYRLSVQYVGNSVGVTTSAVRVENVGDGVGDGVSWTALDELRSLWYSASSVGEGAVTPFTCRTIVATTVFVGEGSDALLAVGLGNSTLLVQADINTPAIKPDITITARSSVSVFTPASNRRTYNQLPLRFHAVSTVA